MRRVLLGFATAILIALYCVVDQPTVGAAIVVGLFGAAIVLGVLGIRGGPGNRIFLLMVLGRQATAVHARAAEIASLVESTEDAVIGTTPVGIITSWNRGAELTYGWTAAETIGQPLEMIVPPATRGAVATSMQQLALGTTAIHHRATGFHRDGHEIDVDLTVCPVFVSGRMAAVSTVARDVSSAVAAEVEREQMRSELAAQNVQLRELDVMKDEFVALVSHELRTPLTAIQGYTELVLDGTAGELNDEQKTMLGAVGRNSTRLFRLINDLLFVAQVNAGKLNVAIEDVDLGAVAAEAIADARPRAAAAEVALAFECEPELMVRADRVRLGQVFDNLISNAIKFTPAGGRVGLTVSLAGEEVVIVVADSGMGMTPEDQQRLFTRFFRTKGAAKIQGTGLGLSITRAILDAHQGSISVESELGQGTRFTVTVPASDPGASSNPTQPRRRKTDIPAATGAQDETVHAVHRIMNEQHHMTPTREATASMACECECDRVECGSSFQITDGDYAAVREHAHRFVVAPGHGSDGLSIIAQTTDYTVVESVACID
jgi:PAS domain S-box-containing protein